MSSDFGSPTFNWISRMPRKNQIIPSKRNLKATLVQNNLNAFLWLEKLAKSIDWISLSLLWNRPSQMADKQLFIDICDNCLQSSDSNLLNDNYYKTTTLNNTCSTIDKDLNNLIGCQIINDNQINLLPTWLDAVVNSFLHLVLLADDTKIASFKT